MTESFGLIDQVRPSNSDRLFFDRYRWCLNFRMPGIYFLRGLKSESPEALETRIKQRHAQWLVYSEKYRTRAVNFDVDKIIALAKFLLPHMADSKLTVSQYWGYLYCNDFAVIESVAKEFLVPVRYVKEAVVTRAKNTVMLRHSDYALRSYFRERLTSVDTAKRIQDYLTCQPDVRISSALSAFFAHGPANYRGSCLFQRYYFFDHNSDATVTLFNLMAPGLIRQTMPVLTK